MPKGHGRYPHLRSIGDRKGRPGSLPARLPVTAHLLGGCPLGTDPAETVADCDHRVHGYPTLHVADGSAIAHNLGGSPSLTITAMAERAFARWPEAAAPEGTP
ncbi:GMC oxidoreductase [Streptomyces sp. YGL11-2]|uniref:GMC oxidoreductase n=1 Tax=Streptomyces sp. YGL11-2 TaxID=3414028 RepID=UPI003CF03109